MNKWRFTFIVLIVGIFYAYKEMKKTYRKIPANKSASSSSQKVNSASSFAGILEERSDAQKREVFYSITIDRFFDGNKDNLKIVDTYNPQGFHGGDFEGIEEKLDYIKNLGVTSIILSNPMLQYKTPYFYNYKLTGEEYELYPFRGDKPISLSKIEPSFGSMSDLKSLVRRAHDLGLKVYLSLNLSYLNRNTALLQREDADSIFDYKAPFCKARNSEDLLKCVPPRSIRFNHDSKEAQRFIFSKIQALHSETNIDGILAEESQHFTESFMGSLFRSIVSNVQMMNFNLIFDVSVKEQPFYNNNFIKGKSSGFIQYEGFTLKLVEYLRDGKNRESFIKSLTQHGQFKRRKYFISDFTAFDSRSTSTVYNKDPSKMLKHAAILGFINTNIQLTYGEEIGVEHGNFPYYNSDMPWDKLKEFKKYRASLSRILTSRSNDNEFIEGWMKVVYDKDGLYIIAKIFKKKVVGYLAINETDQDQTIFHEYQMPLRNSVGRDLITNSRIEALDKGVTFTLDPNGVQFITF